MTTKKKNKQYPRSDIRHWQQRVYRPTFKAEGSDAKKSSHYHVKIQAFGKRRGVSLHTAEKNSAAKAAKKLDDLIRVNGWELGLQAFRGETPQRKNNLTIGEYLAEVQATGCLKATTLRTYTTKIRTIAVDITKPTMPVKKHKNGAVKPLSRYDYVNGGSALWQQMVDSTPLAELNDNALLKWRNEKLKAHAGNPKQRIATTRTVNSNIRAGHALFSPEIIEHISHLELPDPIPFRFVKKLPESIQTYRSEIPSADQLFTMSV